MGPPSDVYREVEPAGLELGAGWVKVALARRQRMERPHLDEPRSGSLKTCPIKSMPSRVGEGRDEVGSMRRGEERSDAAK